MRREGRQWETHALHIEGLAEIATVLKPIQKKYREEIKAGRTFTRKEWREEIRKRGTRPGAEPSGHDHQFSENDQKAFFCPQCANCSLCRDRTCLFKDKRWTQSHVEGFSNHADNMPSDNWIACDGKGPASSCLQCGLCKKCTESHGSRYCDGQKTAETPTECRNRHLKLAYD